MISPRKTRRNAIIALSTICVLVCGGLAWATWSAMRLESVETDARKRRSEDEVRSLAMARLDYLLSSLLAEERSRPFDIFRAYYKPAKAYDSHDLTELHEPILLPSPLRTEPRAEWIFLHFQVSLTKGWSSPQVDSGAESATPASAMPIAERDRYATAENWLAALRDRYDPWLLQEALVRAQWIDYQRRDTIDRLRTDMETTPSEGDARPLSRTAEEFAKRGARMLQLQKEHSPDEACEPQLIALENLQTSEDSGLTQGDDCVPVSGTTMLPVWLDLTFDGRDHLALVRSVNVEKSKTEFCTLQGVLLNWEKLRDMLEAEVLDLYPEATVVSVKDNSRMEPNMLHVIPARLVSGSPAPGSVIATSTGLPIGLIVAWIATLLALAAIVYGTLKYVTISERRLRFVAAVTHELRTPLTSFQLYTDLLSESMPADKNGQRQYVDTLSQESRRLSQLVENVLVYAKMGDSRPAINKAPVKPDEILDAIARTTTGRCESAGKELLIENRCSNGDQVESDPGLVVQILSHLIENACKYSTGASDPRIRIIATPRREGGIEFEIEDAGEGVAPRDRRAIFQPFRRGGNGDRNSGASGLGLGLALSRYWAECLGAQLMLRRSDLAHGQYAKFVLSIPAKTN